MTAFGFDPDEASPAGRRSRPRVVPGGPGWRHRRWLWVWLLAGVILVALVAGRWLLGLRSSYLYYASLGHTNVFWTPFVAQLILFLVGMVITGLLVGVSIPGWVLAARNLDRRGGTVAKFAGIAVAVIAGVGGGAFLSGQWQDVLLWVHGQPFGQGDPVFGQDFSFYLFTLPVLDALQALGWTAALVALLGAIGLAVTAAAIENAPRDVPLPFAPPPGRSALDGLRVAVLHAGVALVAIFGLAALGAHFGVYHLATSDHDTYIGLDAAQRNVVRPILGALQVVALVFALGALTILLRRRGRPATGTAAGLVGLLAGWLVVAGILQTVPPAVYQATSVNPNAQTAQAAPIADFLATTRTAWGLQEGRDVDVRRFDKPVPPTLADLAADPGTLRNVRIQDFRLLPETLAQIDRTRGYQTYPTITVDRYSSPSGDTEVMLGPREIAESNLPSDNFVNRALIYTHGYGITAVSVNRVAAEGKPDILAGQQPLRQVAADAPPDLYFRGDPKGDPRIYCGMETSQPVVVNTSRDEFDYPSGTGDATSHAGTVTGIPVSNGLDRLALSVSEFGGFDLLLTNALTPQSRVLLHRQISDRVTSLAPFLTVDHDPYIVADPASHHLVYVVDAYVKSDRFPESSRLGDGTSYQRNSVKAVIDAKDCSTTLYAVDPSEPLTAAWSAIYPGLLTPIDRMPESLRTHLRYPEDLFRAQSQVYASAHVSPTQPGVFFNRSDFYRTSDELIDRQQQPTQAYYVELTLPGETSPRFVLLQTFSPYSSSGNGANNMTAWLAAESDYNPGNHYHPKLVAVPLNNSDNVLGPLQFDNNINTDPVISRDITLLSQAGSSVVLGNVIVLPFNNHSFLYVRPFYVLAASANGTSFAQLRRVIAGTQNAVAEGESFAQALQTLFNTNGQPIAGLSGGTSPTPTPGPAPGASPSPSPTSNPGALTAEENALLNDLFTHDQAAQAALRRGDLAAFGTEQAAVNTDVARLRTLVGGSSPAAGATPIPAAASPSPSPSP